MAKLFVGILPLLRNWHFSSMIAMGILYSEDSIQNAIGQFPVKINNYLS